MTALHVSALEAAYALAAHLREFKPATFAEAVRQLREGPSESSRLDYVAGALLLEKLGSDAFDTTRYDANGRRDVVAQVITLEAPTWRLAAVRGRKWCLDAVDINTEQVLDWAELLAPNPSTDVAEWWQSLSLSVQQAGQLARFAAGNSGELLTLEYERARLGREGIDREPIWRGFEDNTLGYDIESWMHDPRGRVIMLRIEAKAHATKEARFFLSRNEWATAERFPDSYAFDIWDLNTGTLRRLLPTEVAVAVPKEHPSGEWRELVVRPSRF